MFLITCSNTKGMLRIEDLIHPFFYVGGHSLELGMKEFCLITGFRFGKISLDHLHDAESSFLKRVFPGYGHLKGEDLLTMLES